MKQYLDLLNRILTEGHKKTDRNMLITLQKFKQKMKKL